MMKGYVTLICCSLISSAYSMQGETISAHRKSSRVENFQQQKPSTYQEKSYLSHETFPTKSFLTQQAAVKGTGGHTSYPTGSFFGVRNFPFMKNSSLKSKKSHLERKVFPTHVIAPENNLCAKRGEDERFSKTCSAGTKNYRLPSKKNLKEHQVPSQARQKTWRADSVQALFNKSF